MQFTARDILIYLKYREVDKLKINIIIDVIVIAIIWITAVKGYKKGLVRTLYGVVAFILAGVLTAYSYKYVCDYLMSLSFIKELTTKINGYIAESIVANSDLSMIMPLWMGNSVTEALQSASATASVKIVEILIMIITVIITYLLVKLVLGVCVGILDAIMKLPILDTVNRTGGMLSGIIKGILIVLLCFAVVSLFVTAEKYQYIHSAINETFFAKYFYNNNILMRLIMK